MCVDGDGWFGAGLWVAWVACVLLLMTTHCPPAFTSHTHWRMCSICLDCLHLPCPAATRLAHLLQQAQHQQQQLIGWWVYRPGCTQLHPSLREAAITRALAQWCSQQQQQQHALAGNSAAGGALSGRPLLFAVLSSEAVHNGATSALQQRVYQYTHTSSSQQLQPVRLHIDNLGQDRPSTSGSSGHPHKHSSSSQHQPAQGGGSTHAGVPSSSSSSPAAGSLLAQALQATQLDASVLQQLQGAVAAAQQQAGVLGGVHTTLLQQLEGLAEQVRGVWSHPGWAGLCGVACGGRWDMASSTAGVCCVVSVMHETLHAVVVVISEAHHNFQLKVMHYAACARCLIGLIVTHLTARCPAAALLLYNSAVAVGGS
jgi:hypothetical protein